MTSTGSCAVNMGDIAMQASYNVVDVIVLNG